VVVEGKTELGLLLEFLQEWDSQCAKNGLPTSAGEGVAVQDGNGGSEVGPRAASLAALGIAVLGLLDNDDRTIDAAVESARTAGVEMVRWNLGMNTEAQVCSELSAQGLTRFLELAVEVRNSPQTVLQDLESVGGGRTCPSLDVDEWLAEGVSLDHARSQIVGAAVARKWFKGVDEGRALARWVIKHGASGELAATLATLGIVRAFVYPGEFDATGDVQSPEGSHG
jgi:hypothetical protein